MYITLTDLAGSFQYVIPVVPTNVRIKIGAENETMTTLSGLIRLIGSKKLTGISWSSFFPVNKSYSFADPNSLEDGWDYVTFIETMCKYEIPIRIIVTEDKDKIGFSKRSVLNTLISIDDFEYSTDKVGDIEYSITLTEFPDSIWDYLNTSITAKKYFSELTLQSVARKALQKLGLI